MNIGRRPLHDMDYEKPINKDIQDKAVVQAKVAGRDPNEYAGRSIELSIFIRLLPYSLAIDIHKAIHVCSSMLLLSRDQLPET